MVLFDEEPNCSTWKTLSALAVAHAWNYSLRQKSSMVELRVMKAKKQEAVEAELSKRAREINRRLKRAYPNARCALNHSSALELLIATILSAQCTDERVNIVTADLFRKYPRCEDYLRVPASELENDIRS